MTKHEQSVAVRRLIAAAGRRRYVRKERIMDYELDESEKRKDFHAILRSEDRKLTGREIDEMSWDEARNYYYSHRDEYRDARRKRRDTRKEITFTGFQIVDREELEALAAEKGLKVVKSVTKNLSYLVKGPNAGEKKLQKATENKVRIISVEQFHSL